MDAVEGLHTLNEMLLPRIVRRGIDQIHARLVKRHGIQGRQHTDVPHARILRDRTAVAVHGKVLHHADKRGVAAEKLHYGSRRLRHRLTERVLFGAVVPKNTLIRHLAAGVDQALALRGGAADGKLLERAAVTAHGVTFEMGQHEHGIVVFEILAHAVFPEHLAVGDVQLHVRTFGVHQIDGKIAAPAVVLDQLAVLRRGVALALVGGVALDDRAADALDHRSPELGLQKVLIALLARMELDCYPAGKLPAQRLIERDHLFRRDLPCKIDRCFHAVFFLSPVRFSSYSMPHFSRLCNKKPPKGGFLYALYGSARCGSIPYPGSQPGRSHVLQGNQMDPVCPTVKIKGDLLRFIRESYHSRAAAQMDAGNRTTHLTVQWDRSLLPLIYSAENWSLPAPHRGHSKSSGRSANFVPGAMP